MANIKNMAMAEQLVANPDVEIKNGFFGLCTKYIFRPTGSTIKGEIIEYSAQAGENLKAVLNGDPEKLESLIRQAGNIAPASIGNTRLEAAFSTDKCFAALQLLRYEDFQYNPLTEPKFYTGTNAKLIYDLVKS